MSTMTGKNRIMIYGPKRDGTYVVEFKMAAGEALAISVPASETRVFKYFQGVDALRAICARRSLAASVDYHKKKMRNRRISY
jgi:hypothetical protein